MEKFISGIRDGKNSDPGFGIYNTGDEEWISVVGEINLMPLARCKQDILLIFY